MTIIQVFMNLSWFQSDCLQNMLFSTKGVFLLIQCENGIVVYQIVDSKMYRYFI